MASDRGLAARTVAAARARLGGEFDVAEMVARLDRIYLELLDRPPRLRPELGP
jgi:hypothetical protein